MTQQRVPAYSVLEPRPLPDTTGRRGSSFVRESLTGEFLGAELRRRLEKSSTAL
jgi:hypothetical protein